MIIISTCKHFDLFYKYFLSINYFGRISGLYFAGRIYFVNFVIDMSGDKNIKNSPRDVFAEYLVKHRKRRTPERFAILESVMSTPDHITIESLHDLMESRGFHVSVATIYSTLTLLIDCGLVRRHRFGSDCARYERATGSVNHHHIVCTRCGKVKEIRDSSVGDAISSIRYPGFTASYFSLNIYGLCRACQKRERKTDRTVSASKNKLSLSTNIRTQKK